MDVSGYHRVEHIHCFENAYRRARLRRTWHRLTGQPQTLLPFAPIYAALQQRVGRHLGVQDIPLRQIIGSVDKATQFDRSFRPLSTRSRDRWLVVKMLQTWRGWEPIFVRKIGNLYFVEDGHHRVSVARDAGLHVIEADVVAYPCVHCFRLDASLASILQRLEMDKGHVRPRRATGDAGATSQRPCWDSVQS